MTGITDLPGADLRAMVDSAADGLAVLDERGEVLYANAAFVRLVGPCVAQVGQLGISTDLASREPVDTTVEGPDGPIDLEATAAAFRDPGGRARWVLSLRDVTGRAALIAQLQHQAFHDPLTGLANRALFADRVDHGLRALDRRGGSLGVLFIDLDDFKTVNDDFGHEAGDRVLVSVAERLARCVRPSDTVGRLGGDEFAVCLESLDDTSTVLRITDRVLRSLDHPFEVSRRQVYLTASVGVALADDDDVTAADLVRRADLAMYEAKADGKNGYRLYEDSLHRALLERLDLERRLATAIAANEVPVAYRPVMGLAPSRMLALEAVPRWQAGALSSAAPERLEAVAEESGLMVALGEQIIRQAANELAHRRRTDPRLSVAITLSSSQLASSGLVDIIDTALREADVRPEALVVQVTEADLVSSRVPAQPMLEKLAGLGIGIAVRDFGVGGSSLLDFHRSPIDVVRLSPTFMDLLDEPRGVGVVRAVAALGRTLGLRTVADGVATLAQRNLVRDAGYDAAIGPLFDSGRDRGSHDVETEIGRRRYLTAIEGEIGARSG